MPAILLFGSGRPEKTRDHPNIANLAIPRFSGIALKKSAARSAGDELPATFRWARPVPAAPRPPSNGSFRRRYRLPAPAPPGQGRPAPRATRRPPESRRQFPPAGRNARDTEQPEEYAAAPGTGTAQSRRQLSLIRPYLRRRSSQVPAAGRKLTGAARNATASPGPSPARRYANPPNQFQRPGTESVQPSRWHRVSPACRRREPAAVCSTR